MIKSFSVVAMAALVMVGCNSGSKSGEEVKSVQNYSDAEKLAYAIANQKAVLDSANGKKQSKSTKSRSVVPCESGTMEVFFPVPLDQITEDIEPNKMIFNNCKNGAETANGDMQLITSTDGKTTTLSTLNGFTLTGGEEPGSILPGGTMKVEESGEWNILTINLEMEINGVKHGGENLIYRAKDLSDGGSIEYPVSGKEKIGASAYFTVDPAYDASATPFKTDANGALVSGLFKYIDSKNHSVELEITAKDTVTVRVDEDGNDSFSDTEVSTIKL